MRKRKIEDEEKVMEQDAIGAEPPAEDAAPVGEGTEDTRAVEPEESDDTAGTEPTEPADDTEDAPAPEDTEDPEPGDDTEGAEEPADEDDQDPDDTGEPETFSRAYVEKLRKESARYRERAKRTDELAHRLHSALVAADGRLADPEDLPYDEAHLEDPEALQAAVTALVRAKPGLRARKFTGDIGGGERGTKNPGGVDLLQIMRGL